MLDPRISIYSILITYFGRGTKKLADKYTNEQLRNDNIRETLAFNKRCKRTGVVPRSLLQRPPMKSEAAYKIARKNAMRYIHLYIQDGYRRLKNSNRTIRELKSEIENVIPKYLSDYLYSTVSQRSQTYRTNLKRRLQDKYDRISLSPLKNQNTQNWIVNISSHQLSVAEKSLLNKGLNFSLQNKNCLSKVIASTETAIERLQVHDAEKMAIRHEVMAAIKNAPPSKNTLNREEREALKSLKNNSNIVIAPADKGCSVVVLDQSTYHQKAMEHLNDSNTYHKEDNDPSVQLRGKINRFLKSLLDSCIISKIEYQNLFANTSVIPLFYVLIKTHKTGYPIRPIVSFLESPSYNIAKFISKLLTPFTENSAHKLKNGYDLKNKLKNIVIPATHSLISFDVKALFTSIPQDFALECVESFLQNNNSIFQKTKMNIKEISDMISLCFQSAFFKFDNKIFRQVTGTPMGSPASVVIAEIVMQKIEQLIMPMIEDHIVFWYRYVDDVLTCIENDKVIEILDKINSVNSNIQFTMEKEENSIINYLDLKLTRNNNGTLSFSIYRKPTHTEKYLDFQSNHPLEHKNSVVQSLMYRAFNLCDSDFREQEVNHVSDILENNGYPRGIIKKFEEKTRRKFNRNGSYREINEGTEAAEKSYASIPYIPGISERLKRIFGKYNLEVAHQPTRKLRSELCNLKDKKTAHEKSGVVYRVDCNNCEAKYVGETGRQVRDRMAEHQKDIQTKKPASKVSDHVRETGHNFNFEDVLILDSSNHRKPRLHLESFRVTSEQSQ